MDVACAGILVADLVAKPVEKWPEHGRLELVPNMELHVGGCAANTGGTLAKLGLKVGLFGKVGEDGLGDFIVNRMKSLGVDVSGVKRDSLANTSASMVMVDGAGERSFLHHLGTNARFSIEDMDPSLLKQAKILHVAGSFVLPSLDGEPTAQILRRARENGMITSLDTVWDPSGRWMSLIEPCLPHLDYFLPSLAEARAIAGSNSPEDVASALHGLGVTTVALKMGEQGSFVSHKGSGFYMPPFQVETVDGTGAGDAYVGGFLAGVLQGLSLEETARLASATGALCVTAMGAIQGIPTLEKVRTFMESRS